MTNPADDADFRQAALSCLEPGFDVSEFQRALRARYPDTVVHPRLIDSEPWVIWYVYRDGHWVSRGRAGGTT